MMSRFKRRIFRDYRMARLMVGTGMVFVVLGLLLVVALPILRVSKDLLFGDSGVLSVVTAGDEEIKSTDGRTNILMLGTGGAEHEGPNLSDTMIVASVQTEIKSGDDPNSNSIVLISIPRDIYLDSLGGKINSAFAIGSEKDKEAGLVLAKVAVSQITGLPIHYGIRGDFSAFEKIVNTLGGIDVEVEIPFEDLEYPITGKENDECGFTTEQVAERLATLSAEQSFPCRYETLHFKSGLNHMDGVTALKFARSRHAQGDEGTDFARAKRQQQIISAVKKSVFSTETLLHPEKIESIYKTLKSHIDTDLPAGQIKSALKIGLKYRNSKIRSIVLDEKVLINPPLDSRGWILLPKDGNWDQVHKYIKEQLKQTLR